MKPDNTRFLRQAEQQRHDRLLNQAREAVRHLDAARKPMTVAAVVRASGVSRAFLYRQAALLAEIQQIRERQTYKAPRLPSRQRTSDASQRARIRQLSESNGELRAEIARLRQQNAVLLGRLREEAAVHPRPPAEPR